MPATALVDWEDAALLAGRLARPGPAVTRDEAQDLVASLRGAAERAVEPVLDITAMAPADGRDLDTAQLSDVLVVDRAGWARAAARSMRDMTDDVLVLPSGASPAVAAQVAASAEIGAALAFLSTKILGQFDPYSAQEPGRLLLVAPNVLHVERELGVRPADFRLWVALHEQTHALQFAAAPWLATHLQERTRALVRGMSATSGLRDVPPRLAALVRALYRALRGVEGASLVDGILTREQQVELDAITAVMSLLEGHADVAMDAVGPRLVPSVRSIRRKFEKRRDTSGAADGVVKRLLGMDAKLAQYRDGAAFVRGVTRDVGTAGFNAVWTDSAALPTAHEIADPTAWVRRVHG
ncbi:zinc-dependent metalloprotease [Sanguibacter sp. 25GB23B1]|uniref:zinc-dependent metalloprotease n=1 Tax=unclassified Sanguibacter TaxID=2645534 RepID=UPI0032AEAF07